MPENMPIRYQIDFHMIPSLFYENKDDFRTHLLMAPEHTLADVYTNAYRKLQEGTPGLCFITFRPVDFLVQKKVFAGDRQLVYVTIPSPAEDDCSHVYCEAFALVSTGDNIGSCIGFVDRTGGHHNLGVLCLSAERSVQNRSKAEPLIRKAAELGCPTAIENLTIMSAGGTALKKADFPSILKCAPDNKISNTTKGIEKNINQCEEERNPSGFSSEDERALMAELTRTIDSCSSAPVTNDLEDRARWLMGRVEYFRRRGVPERKLYILEFRILQYMPDFVVRNFSQFYTFLREDISSIYVAVAFHLDKGNFAAAKKSQIRWCSSLRRIKLL